ncbi:hypothetical protein M0R45_020334 [Rubus argutus]|uniref:Uncharacterized protein n=1 Tax=Rubus argutus TaxID=59490 RepID=A0AAW1XA64_RUBAR
MNEVQQLLTIKKEEHSSYQTRLRVLNSTIKELLGFNSEEHSASAGTNLFSNWNFLMVCQWNILMLIFHLLSEMKTTCGMQVKLEKDEDEP